MASLDLAPAANRGATPGRELIRRAPPMRARRLLIAGCGELGAATAAALSGVTVYGLRRSVQNLPLGIEPVAADLLTGDGFERLPDEIDTLVYAPTPAARTEEGYRSIYVDALSRLLEALPRPARSLRLIYVSSTAVYGQNAGESVDEDSDCQPLGFNGRVLLDGERRAAQSRADHVALRLSGLYGPGRHWLLRRVRAGTAIAPGEHWTNRIHVEDAGVLVATLAQREFVPAQVIGVDDAPTTEREVLDWIAARLGLPQLPELPGVATVSGKRLRNDLSRSLGWRPRYASYRDGYTSELPGNTRP